MIMKQKKTECLRNWYFVCEGEIEREREREENGECKTFMKIHQTLTVTVGHVE